LFFYQILPNPSHCVVASPLLLKFGPLFMKKYFLLIWLGSALNALAQFSPGSFASDFTVQDIAGNTRNLYSQLDSGKTVVLHCFTAWDSYAWEYYQQQTLESFDALYGPQGNGSVAVWRVECETQNTLAQLQGPASLSGSNATDTQGDWLTASELPLIDDSTLVSQFALQYVPVIIIVCPDRMVRFADQLSLGNLANLVLQNSCPTIAQGYDPALQSAVTSRDCGSNLLNAQVVLKNLGSDTLFEATIGVEGATPSQTFEWQGQLSSYGSDTISLNGLELLADGLIQFSIADVNVNYENDSLQVRTEVGLSTQLVRLELALDAYPQEVSWEIRNDADSIIYNGGGYEVDYQYINNVFQLPAAGCYQFFLHDNRGDGLYGSQYGGFDGFCKLYSMIDSTTVEEQMFFYDGSYNFSPIENTPAFLQYTFEAGSPLTLNEATKKEWSVFPNPADQFVVMQTSSVDADYRALLFDMTGRMVTQWNGVKGQVRFHQDVSYLPAGVYLLSIVEGDIRTQTQVVIQHP
jgi:hypothetical protein